MMTKQEFRKRLMSTTSPRRVYNYSGWGYLYVAYDGGPDFRSITLSRHDLAARRDAAVKKYNRWLDEFEKEQDS